MTETVGITALGHAGDGIAEIGGTRVFVPFTLPGETVELARTGSRGRVSRLVTRSPDRIAPVCRHFGICGGCALQHLASEPYRAWKRQAVATALAQQGIGAAVDPVMSVAAGSRRRAVLSAVKTGRGAVVGFHRRHTRDIVPIEECPVLARGIVARLPMLAEIAGTALAVGRRARIVVLAADNGLDIAVEGARPTGRDCLEALGRLAADGAVARLTVDGHEIFLNRVPELRSVGGAVLLPPPGAFVQAAGPAEAAMVETVSEHFVGARRVADLFAGIGTFTLPLARTAAVTAVETVPVLLDALKAAADRTSGLRPVALRRRDLFRNPLAPVELDGLDAVVFDPPAAGAAAQAQALAASGVPRIAAVSCNPATLARDCRILIDGGYRLLRVRPLDQFLYSPEIEVVATLAR